MAKRGAIMLAWDHWHIEPSSICTLKCPRCPRAEVPETLLNRQLTLKFFQEQLGASTVKRIRKITFCGNDGDPIYCRELIDIIRWIKVVNPDINLVLITNGSYKTQEWWQELAQVMDQHDEINWSIDGWDQQSNQQYRVNCDWESIMSGMQTFCTINKTTYRVWASIAFRFNQDHLESMEHRSRELGMDLFQITKSTKFGSHYPDTYGISDPLCPDRRDLVSSSHRFERVLCALTSRIRPGQEIKDIFWQRAQDLDKQKRYSGICLIGNKGVFLNSQGEFYPCCWTANRYPHNQQWHDRAQNQFNLWQHSFSDIITDPFWQREFLEFDSQECRTKCTPDRLKDLEHVTEW
jgi:MoaA/NifB/PqqE/SkfB family radical SAM enzyme